MAHRLTACPSNSNWERVYKQRTDFWAAKLQYKDVGSTVYYERCQDLRGSSVRDEVETQDVNVRDRDALAKYIAADGDMQQDAPSRTVADDAGQSDTAELHCGLTGAMGDADGGPGG